MSGMMTPESLSREGSPTPMGEITLHAAPPHNVSAHVSVATAPGPDGVAQAQLPAGVVAGPATNRILLVSAYLVK